MAHVYHWKHGWIPLDHEAAHSAGIQSRQHVALALLAVKNLPDHEQHGAMVQIRNSAAIHGAEDLLPRMAVAKKRSETNWGWEGLPNTADGATMMPTEDVAKHAFDWVHDGSLLDEENAYQRDAQLGLMDSLEAQGVKTPITLHYDPETGKTTVIDGNHRLAAALALGVKNVPVVWWGDPPPNKRPGRHAAH